MNTAMINSNKIVGYALGGGAAKGLFHIGVLSVLEENGIFPNFIAGTSMGAIVGAMYASGLKAADMKQIVQQINWRKILRLTDLSIPFSGLTQGKGIDDLLKSIIEERTFSDLKIPFACVATDLKNGTQVVLKDGLLIDAIRASISLPAILTPKKIDGRYLLDGGLVNVVPVSVCREMGANFVIGVNALSDIEMDTAVLSGPPVQELEGTDYNITALPVPLDHKYSVFQRRSFSIEKGIEKFMQDYQSRLNKMINNNPLLRLTHRKNSSTSDAPYMFNVIIQAITIMEYQIALDNIKLADLAISPMSKNIGSWQFYKADEAIALGEQTTRSFLKQFKLAQ
jgi:predicted acylesterase/phospholipase RssA